MSEASSGPLPFVGVGWQDAAVRYSVDVPNFGEFAAPEVFAEVARRAEEAGWDALLVWDHVAGEKDLRWEIADPWNPAHGRGPGHWPDPAGHRGHAGGPVAAVQAGPGGDHLGPADRRPHDPGGRAR